VQKALVLVALGFLGLVGYRLVAGQLDLVDAAIRACAVLGALIGLQWTLKLVVTRYLWSLERRISSSGTPQPVQLSRDGLSG
jgi:hypothetical protein